MASNTPSSLRRAVIYEVYVRSHTPEGTFRAIEPDLDRIRALERLLESSGGDTDCIDAFFAAANEDGEGL